MEQDAMIDKPNQIEHRAVPAYVVVIPWLGLFLVILSLAGNEFRGEGLIIVTCTLSGLGVLLGLCYFIMSTNNNHSKSVCSTGISLLLSLFVMIFGALAPVRWQCIGHRMHRHVVGSRDQRSVSRSRIPVLFF